MKQWVKLVQSYYCEHKINLILHRSSLTNGSFEKKIKS